MTVLWFSKDVTMTILTTSSLLILRFRMASLIQIVACGGGWGGGGQKSSMEATNEMVQESESEFVEE